MRRLRIIDLTGGDQPLFNEDSSLALVANGEIYNHLELREELEGKGHVFKTHSDCETILHLYEQHGEEFIHKLRGMFAFALHDVKKKTVFIARDRLGEKPLYYYSSASELVFSSEMKSLLACLRSRGLKTDADALNMFLHYQYVPEPYTCVEGVKKLPAGHYMTVSLDGLSVTLKRYWDYDMIKPVSGNPAELVREGFDELSRFIIRSDVPVGVALSGGIDSSAIAVFAAKHYKDRMHAFSVGYPGRPKNDERAQAKGLADKVGFRFHEVELKTEEFAKDFCDLVYHMDDPIADIAAYGYYSVNREARKHGIPVLLSGIGGDELFWGYAWMRDAVDKNRDKLRIARGEATGIKNMVSAAMDFRKTDMLLSPLNTLKNVISNVSAVRNKFASNPNRFIFYDEHPDFNGALGFAPALYTEGFRDKVDASRLYSFFTDENWDDVAYKLCEFLMRTWLYSNCVALSDRMSMASSVEGRLPFLDYRFVELVMGLRKTYPEDYKLGYKSWFIEAMKGIIPDEVLTRKKSGFTPPVKEWYGAVVRRYGGLCADGYLVNAGVMKRKEMIDFINSAANGGRLFFAYKIVLLEVWCRRFIVGESLGENAGEAGHAV